MVLGGIGWRIGRDGRRCGWMRFDGACALVVLDGGGDVDDDNGT